MEPLTVDSVWDRDVYDGAGRFLGRVVAVGMGRDRVPRRVGLPVGAGRRLRFFSLSGATIVDGHVVLGSTDPTLIVHEGGQ